MKIRNSFIFFVKRLKTCVEQVPIWDKSRALPPPKTIPTDLPVKPKHFKKKFENKWKFGISFTFFVKTCDEQVPIWDNPQAPPLPKTIPTDSPVMYLKNREKIVFLNLFFVKTCGGQVTIIRATQNNFVQFRNSFFVKIFSEYVTDSELNFQEFFNLQSHFLAKNNQ